MLLYEWQSVGGIPITSAEAADPGKVVTVKQTPDKTYKMSGVSLGPRPNLNPTYPTYYGAL